MQHNKSFGSVSGVGQTMIYRKVSTGKSLFLEEANGVNLLTDRKWELMIFMSQRMKFNEQTKVLGSNLADDIKTLENTFTDT